MSNRKTLGGGKLISSQGSAGGPTPCASPAGPWGGPSGLAPALVSPSQVQGKLKDWGTSGTYGPLFCGSSPSASLQSSLESRLKARLAGIGSPGYVLTWKHWDMPSGLPICALRASERPSDGRGSGGWQTPTTRDGKGQSGRGNRIKRGKNGRLHVANLCDQIVDLGRPDLVRSTAFRCWLMGYPESWELVRATGMQSSRKSPPNSSKRT